METDENKLLFGNWDYSESNGLEDLKEGDEVIVLGREYEQLCAVDRATNNYIFVKEGKYRRFDGVMVNDKHQSKRIVRATPKLKEEFQKKVFRATLIKNVRDLDLESLSNERLDLMFKIATLE